MAVDLTKLTMDVATLHKLAIDQHDLLATLRTQLDAAMLSAKATGENTAADAATQAALDAIDATVRDATERLSGTVTPTPAPAPTPVLAPVPGAPTGVQVPL